MAKISSVPQHFAVTTAPIPYDQQYKLLSYYEAEEDKGELARPIVVQVNVYNDGSAGEAAGIMPLPYAMWLPANWAGDLGDSGRLRFTYGAGPAKRVITTDLKSGAYQLPPSDSVTVEASVSSTIALPFSWNLTITARCVEGWQAMPARATQSVVQLVPAASEVGALLFPSGARWVDLMINANGVGAGKPIIEYLDQAGGSAQGSNYMLRDYVNEVYLPGGGPMEIGSVLGAWRLKNSGASDAIVTTQFFLEF